MYNVFRVLLMSLYRERDFEKCQSRERESAFEISKIKISKISKYVPKKRSGPMKVVMAFAQMYGNKTGYITSPSLTGRHGRGDREVTQSGDHPLVG